MGTKIVYNHKAIEKKWREKWEETPVNQYNIFSPKELRGQFKVCAAASHQPTVL